MTVKTWVCNICGDPYIGEDKPTHCPFCGAPDNHIVKGEQYEEPKAGELTEQETNNILAAIKLEVANAEFYFCASRKSTVIEVQKRFKAVGKVETEHAGVLSKIIRAQKPAIDRNADVCEGDDESFIKTAIEREEDAVKHYKEFLEQSEDTRVKQVFGALVEIEKTHIELEEE